MKLVLFISYYFSKICHKNLKKYLLMKVNIKKFLSKYICRQLKCNHFIRNYFKCLWLPHSITCSTKVLTLTIAPILCILLASSVNLLWCQVCTFYCPLRKNRFTFLPEGLDIHIQEYIYQKDLNFCHIMLLCQGCCWTGKNTNKKFSCVMVLIVRLALWNSNLFLVSIDVSEKSFPY